MEYSFKKPSYINEINEKIYHCFISFCISHLKLTQPFSVELVDKNHGIDMTLAAFDLDSNEIYVRCEKRFIYDICRSIAHELVHLKQKEDDKINYDEYTDVGGIIEDEANAIAGQICKIFVKKFNCKWIYNV